MLKNEQVVISKGGGHENFEQYVVGKDKQY
jgi:hypothetical protein